MNHWIDRFQTSYKIEDLRAKFEKDPIQLSSLEKLHPVAARNSIENHLSKIDIISDKTSEALNTLVAFCYAGAVIDYPDKKTFLQRIYSFEDQLDNDDLSLEKKWARRPLVFCLTGSAGVGKTKLIGMIKALIPDGEPVEFSLTHSRVSLRGVCVESIVNGNKKSSILNSLARSIGVSDAVTNFSENAKVLSSIAYRDGFAALAVDELQHFTLASNSNVAVTSLLLNVRQLAIPFIYVCNFSLLHKLLARPQEDKDRLLANIYNLEREEPSSKDWKRMVGIFAKSLGTYWVIDVEGYAAEIGRLTACHPRYLIWLIGIGYMLESAKSPRQARLSIESLRNAFSSQAYYSPREEVLALTKGMTDLKIRRARSDLFLPEGFESGQLGAGSSGASAAELKERAVTEMVMSALTLDEKARQKASSKTGKSLPRKRSNEPRSAATLLAAHALAGSKK